MSDEWGVGNKAGAEPFAKTRVEGRPVDLILGEHPHSRQDNRVYARWPDGTIEPFSGHRVLVDVSLHTANYLKESELSGNDVRKSVRVEVAFDGLTIYAFGHRDTLPALLKAHHVVAELIDHPCHPWNEEVVVGRGVWYRGEPARVAKWERPRSSVWLTAETETGLFRGPPWGQGESTPEVEVDLLDGNIYWFRDDPTKQRETPTGVPV